MKLADDFFINLKDQFKKVYKKDKISNAKIKQRIRSNYMHLTFAALLHDIGHAPLSHLGEEFYDKCDIQEKINVCLQELGLKKFDFNTLKEGNSHEWMSVLVIIGNKDLYKILMAIYEFDIEYLARIITGNKYGIGDNFEGWNKNLWDKDLIISIVNSKTIDVDKLDYLMRDNYMTGFVGPKIDIVRLLSSLTITEGEGIQAKQLGFTKVGISSIQKIIECRDNVYLWVCNHHTVVYSDYLLRECISHMIELNKYTESSDKEPPEYINEKRIYYQNKGNPKNILCDIKNYYTELSGEQDGCWKLKDTLSNKSKKQCVALLKDIKYLPYAEAFNKNDYFSTDAILKHKVTDSEIYTCINSAKNMLGSDLLSIPTERLLGQLKDRNFLKPIWKTLSQYKQFMQDNFKNKNDQEIIVNFITKGENSEENRRKIVRIICKRASCNVGEVFLVIRKNKFYFPTDFRDFIVCNGEGEKQTYNSIDNLLPQKDYSEMFEEVSFYLFCKDNKKDAAGAAFVELMKDYRKIESTYKEEFGDEPIKRRTRTGLPYCPVCGSLQEQSVGTIAQSMKFDRR